MRRLIIAALIFFTGISYAAAAPIYNVSRSLIPETDGTYSLGTTTPGTTAWKNLIVNQICLTADTCRTTWPTGSGSSFAWPFNPATGYVATSTTVGFFNGLFSSASSTFGSSLYLTNTKSQSCLGTDSNGLVGAGTCSGGSSFAYLFPNNATTTVLTLSGLVSIASTTISASTTITGVLTASGGIFGALTGNASTATALAANGTNCSAGNYPLGVDASGNAENCTAAAGGSVSAVTGTWPVVSSGGTTPAISWNGLATTSAFVDGRVLYGSGVNGIANVATSTISFSGPFSGTGFGALIGGSNTTVTYTGLATTSIPTAGNLFYSNGVAGLIPIATSSLGVTGPITFSGTIGAQVGGASGNFGCATCVLTSRNINTTYPIAGGGALSGDLTLTFSGLATTSTWTAGQLAYAVNGNTVTSVATTTLTFSGPFSGTGFGALVGGANTTVAWTGLATSSAIASNEILYGTSVSGVAGNTKLVWLNGPGWYGNGTSTPQWLETLATTTAPQLVLQGGVSDAPWAERSIGGALYFATTTNTATFATSSAANTALTIDANGIPRFSALGGVAGCAQFDNTGKLSNTGTGCTTGTVTNVTATFPLTSSGGATPALTFVGIGTSSPLGTNQAVYSTGVNTVASVATTTLGFSGPFSGLGNGALLGGANTTITWTGLATTTALTANQVLYAANSTSGVAGSNNFVWNNAAGWLGVGTSTPQWLVTLATTTAPQLVLQGAKTDAPWSFRSIGGYLYVATTTNTASFATTTMAAFSITIGGEVTTGELDVATTTTTTTIDWVNTPNQVRLRIGSAATNLQFINATNSAMLGSRKLVYVCNPPTVAAGAVTWVAVEWIGSTPTQTTTAAQCDVVSFDITQGTSTSAVYKIAGSAGAGFQ